MTLENTNVWFLLEEILTDWSGLGSGIEVFFVFVFGTSMF